MRIAGLAGLLLLAACGEEKALPPERPDAVAVKMKSSAVKLPERLDIGGRWAASRDMCETGWWDFGGDDVHTAGELGCSVVQDERTVTTATLRLTCVGEGMPIEETWRIEGTRERIVVDRSEVGTMTLVKCPEF